MQFALNDDQLAIRDMARAFAAEKIAPHALDWDERKHFPLDVMREAAALRIGGNPVRRPVHLRGAGAGMPDRLGVHLDPQHGVMDDRRLWVGSAAPQVAAGALDA